MLQSVIFPILVFGGVTVVTLFVFLALFGRFQDPRLKQRIRDVHTSEGVKAEGQMLIREQYLRHLTPLERTIERLPGLERLAYLLEQTGRFIPAYRVALLCLGVGLLGALIFLYFSKSMIVAGIAFLVILPLPVLKLISERNQRMNKFEEQLPDALDVMSRAMRAGNPFNEALKFVAEEMADPISTEFGRTFSDINYGVNPNVALGALLGRVPNVSLSAVVTAILVQRETGGNLAEILDKITDVIRQRFRFQRKLRTLTAEGRLSAWILVLFPFVMSGILSLTAPAYLPKLFDDPLGPKILMVSAALMVIGIYWIRKTIKLKL